jgi:hypothetical protein
MWALIILGGPRPHLPGGDYNQADITYENSSGDTTQETGQRRRTIREERIPDSKATLTSGV